MLDLIVSWAWFGMTVVACCIAIGVLLVSAWGALVYLADMQEYD